MKTLVAWSSGKDSALALHELRRRSDVEVVGLLTTVTENFARVAMHGTREAVLDAQARAANLPITKVRIPFPCPNEVYEQKMRDALEAAKMAGVEAVAFGDLFLEDVRAYRETRMQGTGIAPMFPLWSRPTPDLVREMIAVGIRAKVACVDSKQISREFVGRDFDASFIADLPPTADPCGENGEFHTIVYAGPMFGNSLQLTAGEIIDRDGFIFADFFEHSAPR